MAKKVVEKSVLIRDKYELTVKDGVVFHAGKELVPFVAGNRKQVTMPDGVYVFLDEITAALASTPKNEDTTE